MSAYRPVTDPAVKPRTCTCGQLVVGFTERGLVYWLDAAPLSTPQVAIGILTGRMMFTVHRRATTAVIDWLNPSPALAGAVARFLANGEVIYPAIVLAEHTGDCSPDAGTPAPMPDWNVRPVPALKPVDF